jgi:trimethylamine:corrinoid methyltransferase-like protein
LKDEILFPGPVINRANNARWIEEGSSAMEDRAHKEVEKLSQSYHFHSFPEETKKELVSIMEIEAKHHGQDKLPERI